MGDRYLIHYASPYYDPVKAHEYYMEHRQLKGRTSTAGLNDEGKKVASYVKNQITEERKQKIQESKNLRDYNIKTINESAKSRTESNNASAKNQTEAISKKNKDEIESNKQKMNSSIERLKARLNGMNKEDKAKYRSSIQMQIEDLRATNAETRTKLSEGLRSDKAKISESRKQANDSVRTDKNEKVSGERTAHSERVEEIKRKYDDMYVDELDKIASESQYQKTKKASSSKSSKSSSKKESSGPAVSNYTKDANGNIVKKKR